MARRDGEDLRRYLTRQLFEFLKRDGEVNSILNKAIGKMTGWGEHDYKVKAECLAEALLEMEQVAATAQSDENTRLRCTLQLDLSLVGQLVTSSGDPACAPVVVSILGSADRSNGSLEALSAHRADEIEELFERDKPDVPPAAEPDLRVVGHSAAHTDELAVRVQTIESQQEETKKEMQKLAAQSGSAGGTSRSELDAALKEQWRRVESRISETSERWDKEAASARSLIESLKKEYQQLQDKLERFEKTVDLHGGRVDETASRMNSLEEEIGERVAANTQRRLQEYAEQQETRTAEDILHILQGVARRELNSHRTAVEVAVEVHLGLMKDLGNRLSLEKGKFRGAVQSWSANLKGAIDAGSKDIVNDTDASQGESLGRLLRGLSELTEPETQADRLIKANPPFEPVRVALRGLGAMDAETFQSKSEELRQLCAQYKIQILFPRVGDLFDNDLHTVGEHGYVEADLGSGRVVKVETPGFLWNDSVVEKAVVLVSN